MWNHEQAEGRRGDCLLLNLTKAIIGRVTWKCPHDDIQRWLHKYHRLQRVQIRSRQPAVNVAGAFIKTHHLESQIFFWKEMSPVHNLQVEYFWGFNLNPFPDLIYV